MEAPCVLLCLFDVLVLGTTNCMSSLNCRSWNCYLNTKCLLETCTKEMHQCCNFVGYDNSLFTAAFTWLCSALYCLHSGIVVFEPLCWLPILPCREPRSIMGFRRKPYTKCKTDFPIWCMIEYTHIWCKFCYEFLH